MPTFRAALVAVLAVLAVPVSPALNQQDEEAHGCGG